LDEYALSFARSARKELEVFDERLLHRIFPRIDALSMNPRPRGCKKIEGEEDLWRIRIGQYRVLYRIYDADKLVDVIAIRHRRDAYR